MKKIKAFSSKLKSRQRFTRLLGDPSKIKGLRSGLVNLGPRESVGEHKTENKEEVIIILKGSAVICHGKNKKIKAPQNTFVYIPPETVHNVKNSGRRILRYLYVTAALA
ncbi:cupin domain-containing protein [bacterium]|nr:MAG: cupin domain-containing protein [bacterium]